MTGPGAEARNSIGLVLVAGMAIGTAFTVFFVPAIYMLIARDRRPAAVAPSPGLGGRAPSRDGIVVIARTRIERAGRRVPPRPRARQ